MFGLNDELPAALPRGQKNSSNNSSRNTNANTTACLLDSMLRTIAHVYMPAHYKTACALWTLHTHVFEEFRHSPRLLVLSPAPQSGKSTLLETLALIAARAELVQDITPASFRRLADEMKPTIILDDFDSLTKSKKGELMNIYNASSAITGATRLVNEEGRALRTFIPMAIGSNEALPAAQTSRAIVLHLMRAPMDRLRRPETLDADRVQQRCDDWRECTLNTFDLDPPVPPELDARQADYWRPLLAIATKAGPDWTRRAHDAARMICADAKTDSGEPFRVALLRSVRDVFVEDKMFAADLADALRQIEDARWGEIGLTPNKLSIELSAFRIRSKTSASTPGPKRVTCALILQRHGPPTFKQWKLRNIGTMFRSSEVSPSPCPPLKIKTMVPANGRCSRGHRVYKLQPRSYWHE